MHRIANVEKSKCSIDTKSVNKNQGGTHGGSVNHCNSARLAVFPA